MQYSICVNLPGYLPEAEPYEVDGIEAAREALTEELDRTTSGLEHYPDDCLNRAKGEAAKLGERGGTVLLNGYAHSANPVIADLVIDLSGSGSPFRIEPRGER